jgi:rod shape-determining protein MreD
MNIYKYLAVFLSIVVAVIFQPTFFAKLGLPGATPDLVLVVVACWAITKGPAVGIVAGFLAGFLIDVAPPGNHLMGIASIILALLGYVIGIIGSGQSRSILRPLLVSSMAATSFFVFRTIWAIFAGNSISLEIFSLNFLTQGLYAAVLAIFVYPGITYLDRKLGPLSRSDELRMQ